MFRFFSPFAFRFRAALLSACVIAACSESDPYVAVTPGVDAGPAKDGGRPPTSDAASILDTGSATDVSDKPDVVTDAPADVVKDVAKGPFACNRDTAFPATFSIAEASAATEVQLYPGIPELLIVSDSGHAGSALLYHLAGATTRTLTLPLDSAASDDVEGIAWRDGRLYTLTSSGAVQRFAPNGSGGLVRDQNAYPLGASPYACSDLGAINCGKNYEGLCLRSAGATSPCAGYAASKTESKLYCLTLDAAGVLSASTTVPPITLALNAEHLSDCAFGTAGGAGEGALVVTTNVYNFSRSYRVEESTGALEALPAASLINNEAIAIDTAGRLYVFDDNSSGTSTASRDLCQNW